MFTLKGTHVSARRTTSRQVSQEQTPPPTYSPTMASGGSAEHGGYISDEDAIPKNNPTDTTELLAERLQAWKHMCGYLENYISAVAKDQKTQAKDQEKILKELNHPLREGHHFDQALGGVSGLFENLRTNTQSQISLHGETSKSLTSSILPILERLHSEIKSKAKELEKGAGKGSKAVQSARDASQKHIELLGQHSASHDASGSKTTANTDPYVLQKQIYHRLNKQLAEENNNRGDLIAVQNSFKSFEAHVIQTVQTALNQYHQLMAGQHDRQKAMYADVAGYAGRIAPDFEWNGFLHRNGDKLIDPNAPQRTIDSVTFPNQNHRSTQALIEGTLERKGKGLGALGGYTTGFYAITPTGYLHEFKESDNYRHDPSPEHSLYLKDCVIGALDGVKFTIKGKDTSGSKLAQKMSTSSEYSFKAASPADAQQWHAIISSQTNANDAALASPVSPTNPPQQHATPLDTTAAAGQTTGMAGVAAEPQSAATTHTSTSIPSQTPALSVSTGQTSVPASATAAPGEKTVPHFATGPHVTNTQAGVAAPGAVPTTATPAPTAAPTVDKTM